MIPDVQQVAADEEQLDARLAELLHTMHRRHLALEESRPDSPHEPAMSRAAM